MAQWFLKAELSFANNTLLALSRFISFASDFLSPLIDSKYGLVWPFVVGTLISVISLFFGISIVLLQSKLNEGQKLEDVQRLE